MPTILTLRRSKLIVLLFAAALTADAAGSFDYYLLSLSWTPDFCALPGANKDPRECAPGRHLGFTVHGLWPQADSGRGPENCGAPPVSGAIVSLMLNYIPAPGLIQHEWRTHGSCTGLSAADYFARVRQARDQLKVPAAPDRDRAVSPGELTREFVAANPGFPAAAFRTTCGRGELQEVRVCFTKNLTPRACSGSAGQCRSPSMLMRHPR